MDPVLTVIIPAFNCEKTLGRTLASLEGAGEELEILLVDDGSRDSTGEIAGAFCRTHPGSARLIRQENRGHGGAINRGVQEARGTYLKVLDGDDWADREALPALLRFLGTCTWDVVLTNFETHHEKTGECTWQRADPRVCGRTLDPGALRRDLGRFRPVLTFHGLTCRREFYRSLDLRLTEKVYYEDMEYLMVPLCCAGTLGALDLTFYHYRVGGADQSISRENRCRRLSHREKVLRDLLQFPERYPILREPERRALYERLLRSFLMTWLMILLLDLGDRQGADRLLQRIRPWSGALYRQLLLPAEALRLLSGLKVTADRAEAFLERRSRLTG